MFSQGHLTKSLSMNTFTEQPSSGCTDFSLMNFKFFYCVVAVLLAGNATLSAKPVLVNGGRDLNNLAKLENKLNDGGANIDLSVATRNGRWPMGYLEMAQAGKFTNPALCAAWHSKKHQPGTGEYTVSAEVMLVGDDEVYDGVSGVIGWLDTDSGVGISFALNHYEGFQVGTVSFLADDADTNRSLDGLFELDGSPARESTDSAWSDKGSHDASKWVRMELMFSAPTKEDIANLADVTARITASIFKSGKNIVEGTREITLLTNLPLPGGGQHRFGYFGYWDSIWDEGGKIAICRNLKIDGELYNSPPTIEPIADLAINQNGTAELVVVVDDLEVYSSKLEVNVVSSDTVLVPSGGIQVGTTGSRRTVVIIPAVNMFGDSMITVNVSDGDKWATASFTLTVKEANEPPVLSIVRGEEGKLTVEWASGSVLQSSTDLKKWESVEPAVSPFTVDSPEAQKYFRVVSE